MLVSPDFKIRVKGDFACFTRPDFPTERVTYDVPTPTASIGIVRSILSKPQVDYHIKKIYVLNPFKYFNYKTNELKEKSNNPTGKGNLYTYIEEKRMQRNSLILQDVDYVIEYFFTLSDKEFNPTQEMVTKYTSMILRRLDKGQRYYTPYLGMSDFKAFISKCPDNFISIQETKPLGLMPWSMDYSGGGNHTYFNAILKNGVLEIPSSPEFIPVNFGV